MYNTVVEFSDKIVDAKQHDTAFGYLCNFRWRKGYRMREEHTAKLKNKANEIRYSSGTSASVINGAF